MARATLQQERVEAQRTGSADLEDTGVGFAVRLNTAPVTLREAEVTLAFIRRSLDAAVKATKSRYEDVALVPVVEIGSGSIEIKMRFFNRGGKKKKKKKRKEGDSLLKTIGIEAAREAAKVTVGILIGAVAIWAGVKPPPAPAAPPAPPGVVLVVAKEARPGWIDLRHELGQSGKPWSLDVTADDGRTVALGPPRPLPAASRNQDIEYP